MTMSTISTIVSIVLFKIGKKFKKVNIYLIPILILAITSAIMNTNIEQYILDSYAYKMTYTALLNGIPSNYSDVGFQCFTLLLAKLKVPIFYYFLIISMFQIYVFYKFAEKYSSNLSLSMIIYTLTFYFQHNFNIIRQGIAVTFTIIALHLILSNKKWKSVVFFILAFLFHKSAIVFLIVYLINDKEISNKVFYKIGIIFTLFFSIFFSNIINKAIVFITQLRFFGDKYGNYTAGSFFIDHRLTYLYVLSLIFLGIVAYLSVNSSSLMSIEQRYIFKIFYFGVIFSLFVSLSVILRRLGNYFIIYQAIIIPFIPMIFKEKKFIEYGLVFLYLIQWIA